ncbi:MAG: glycoside hydrolase family 1 protein [SAR324 cluster bacterium]|nr:glycoside hydrolase family 1 protein [SAR324 cluster bacterium]
MQPFQFPQDFLFGTATASLQIEGGDRNNSWYRWAEQGHIHDGTHCIVANDHWNRVEEDIGLMQAMNCQTYRMSLEWSRIEPKPGKFDKKVIRHYRNEIALLIASGIRPLVTLHHFSNPLWLEDIGAWTNPKVIRFFKRYASWCVKNLGDLVSDWCTLNEPNIYLVNGYLFGNWPPGKNFHLPLFFKAAKNMIQAHITVYQTIHKMRKKHRWNNTSVGVAHHLRVFDPATGTLQEKLLAQLHYTIFQDMFVAGMTEGKLIPPLGVGKTTGKARYSDFFGINYYTRDMIRQAWNPQEILGIREVPAGAPVNDLGWEIYPEGLYRTCKRYYERYQVPLYITENGICDRNDTQRSRYIFDHLKALRQALDEGINIQRYYHWTLMDNFEWAEGLSAKFGLVEVNYENQRRTIRRSGLFYTEICRNKAVTPDMIQKWLL